MRLAISDITIHDVTQKFRPLNSRSEKRTLKIFISAARGKRKRGGAILPRKVTVITRTLFLKHEGTTKSALYIAVGALDASCLDGGYFMVNSQYNRRQIVYIALQI